MKMSLVVLTEGKASGKTIPVTLSQFIIGRDPQCQLRPASAVISKRHCALIARGGKYFVRDFGSTNGTFVNDKQVKGECEVKHDDVLKVGPLQFRIAIEGAPVAVNKQTPLPPPAAKESAKEPASDDDSVAAMLLDIVDEGKSPAKESEDGVPEGSTEMEIPKLDGQTTAEGETKAEGQAAAGANPQEPGKPPAKPAAKKQDMNPDTSAAANAILQKYMRRQR
jgi:pSer/pThr/pTyr-binding forkhead associated (FHA) protein